MAYSGGDDFPCVVADVGSYATKMGFAGESYPRSYFRTTTAIHRNTTSNDIVKRSYDFFTRPLGSLDGSGNDSGNASTTTNANDNVATAEGGGSASVGVGVGISSGFCDDGNWEVCNPIDQSTGLIYEGRKFSSSSASSSSSSHNSNNGSNDTSSAAGGGGGAAAANASPSKSTSSTTISSPQHEAAATSSSSSSSPTTPTGECYIHFLNHLRHGYNTALSSTPSNTPLLLIERSYNPPPIRQKLLEIVFEELGVPATFFARDAVCACYAVGRSTGTVVDIGHHGTVVTPVYEGYVETKGIFRSPVGTGMVDELILQNLDGLYKTKRSRSRNKLNSKYEYVMPLYQTRSQRNMPRREPFHTLARLDMVRQCREDGSGAGVASFGYVSLHDLVPEVDENGDEVEEDKPEPSDIYQQYAIAPKTPYKLPDGTMVDIPQVKRFDVSELMFAKAGGRSAALREEAVRKKRDQLASIIGKSTSAGGGDDGEESSTNASANANANSNTNVNINPMIAQMEEMTKRKRGGSSRNSPSKKQQTAYISNEKLIAACTPYLQPQQQQQQQSSQSTPASTASCMIGELSASSIPAMICDSVFRCDRDQQAQLLANAILCGGGACLSTSASSSSSVDYKDGNAMPERIREEVEAIVHAHTPNWRVKVLSPGLSERAVCSWLGGSILGSLGSFHEMWITKAEYEEHGTSIVNRKCP